MSVEQASLLPVVLLYLMRVPVSAKVLSPEAFSAAIAKNCGIVLEWLLYSSIPILSPGLHKATHYSSLQGLKVTKPTPLASTLQSNSTFLFSET